MKVGCELTADYCNYDDEAIGVQFYGVGQAHVNAEEFYRNFNPQTILALLDAYESSARDAERYRWLRQPNALRRAAHIAVLTHNGGFVACEEQADQAIDAARHATQGD